MRRTALLLSLGCALILAGCGQGGMGGGGADKRIAELEKQVKASQDRDRDLRTKMAARESLGEWGWNSFLSEPEFWQCTYDSAYADCSNRCSKDYVEANKICMEKPVGPERQSCLDENDQRNRTCQMNCPRPTERSGVSSCFM